MSSLSTQSILAVDDDPGVLNLCRDILGMGGYEVVGARSGEEALRLMAPGGTDFQLALLDIMMPEMNGVEAARRIQAANPSLKVVLMSGYDASEVARLVGTDSTYPIIWKPFRAESLLRMIENVLKTAGEGNSATAAEGAAAE